MMSSGQIAGMMSQQNQMFAGAAQYSHQISASMPNMYGGANPGGSGFSYGSGQPMGYDFSSRAGGGAVSAMGGAAQFALGAGSLMAGMGMMGGVGRAMLDPFAGGGAMYRMGGRAGMGMMGRLGMGAIGMAPVAAGLGMAGHAIGSTMAGAQEQAQVEQVMGRHKFISPQSGQQGFTRPQTMAMGDMMRRMESLPEMMTSMGELTRIMDKMGGMGLMQGAQNVSDFGQKFKDTIKVLKDMSKVMGTTMEEALPLFGEIRRSGIYSTSDILKNAMNRQVTGATTGMNQGQVGALQSMGSQVSFAYGGSRAGGGRHALRVANQLGMANQMGFLSNDQITELTGQEGAAGIQAMAGQLTQTGYKMSRGALGTAMTLALGSQEDGRYTGEMDQELMEQFRSGDISRAELMKMARQKTRSRGSKLSYVARRKAMRANMASAMGVEGQLQMLKGIMGGRGFTDPDELRIVAQRFGMSEREADMMVELAPKFEEMQIEMGQRKGAEARRISQEAFMKENYSWGAVKNKLGKRVSNIFSKPFKDFGASLRNSVNETIDNFVDDITGRYKVEVTKGMSELARGAMGDIGTSRARMGELLTSTRGMTGAGLGAGQNMTSGYAGAMADWATGRVTAGERMEFAGGLVGVHTSERDVGTSGTGVMRGGKMVGGDRDIITSRDYGKGWTGGIGTQGQINQERYLTQSQARTIEQTYATLSRGGDTSTITALKASSDKASKEMFLRDYMVVQASNPGFGQLKDEERLGSTRWALARESAFSGNAEYVQRLLGGDAASAMAFADRAAGGGGLQDVFGGMGKYQFTAAGGAELAGDIKKTEASLRATMGAEAAEEYMAFVGKEGGSAQAEALMGTLVNKSDLVSSQREETASERSARRGRGGILAGGGKAGTRMVGDSGATNLKNLRRIAREDIGGMDLSKSAQATIDKQPVAYKAAKNEALFTSIMMKAGKGGDRKFTKQELEYMKSELQISDPDKLTPELAKELEGMRAMLASGDPEQMKKYLDQKLTSGNVEIGSRLSQAGKEQNKRLADLRGMKGLVIGDELEGALKMLGGIADKQEGATDVGGLGAAYGLVEQGGKFVEGEGATSVTQDIGAAAEVISGLSGKDRKIAMAVASPDVKAAVRRYDYASGLSSKKLSKKFAVENFIGKSAVEQELGEKARGFLEKGDEKGLARFLASDQGGRSLVAAGVETRSQYANQAEIANTMAKFSENTRSLASIVAAMGGGEQKGEGGSPGGK